MIKIYKTEILMYNQRGRNKELFKSSYKVALHGLATSLYRL